MNFPITGRFPPVIHLTIHLENGQRVYFTDQNVQQRAEEPPISNLLAFFKLCEIDDFARTLLYAQVPTYFTWNSSQKRWNRRKQGSEVPGYPGIYKSDALGRVYTVHPNNFECFCVRLLMHVKRGPVSFIDLRTVDGQICSTFREACNLLGLLEDDAHWNATLEEATVSQSPSTMRYLFAIMITACEMSDPKSLWDIHKEALSEDVKNRVQREHPQEDIQYTPDMFNEALIYIEDLVLYMSGKDLTKWGLPSPNRSESATISREWFRETNYNTDTLAKFVSDNEPLLVQDQSNAYQLISEAVQEGSGGIFFLDAPGGTGKTFVLNHLLAKMRSLKKIAFAIASSGIAATLLSGGRTAHSAFKLPLDLATMEYPVCGIGKQTEAAKVLKNCDLIVWDEGTMSPKDAFEALDRTMRDLRGVDLPIGGVTLVISGDFRQTLPVVPRGTPADEMKASIKSSYLWTFVQTIHLTTNMRVKLYGDFDAGNFTQLLLKLGNGEIPNTNDVISIPDDCGTIVSSMEELEAHVYPNLATNYKKHTVAL